MPIENERKFVLNEDGQLEPRLADAPGITCSRLSQAYLDSPGVRIRAIETSGTTRHVFGFKRPVDGQMVEIIEAIDAGPHLGDAGEVPRMRCSRCRPCAHNRAGDACGAQFFRRIDDRLPFLLGDPGDAVRRALMVGVAGMGHDTRKLDSGAW